MGIFRKLLDRSRKARQLATIGIFDGHVFRAFTRLEDLPAMRYMNFVDHIGFVNTVMTREGLLAYSNLITKAINEQEYSQAAFYASQMKQEVESFDPAKNLMRIGSLLVLMDNESPDTVSEDWIMEKAILFDKSAEFRAFFLKVTYLALQKYGVLNADLNEESFVALTLDLHEQAYSMVTGRRIYWGFSNS